MPRHLEETAAPAEGLAAALRRGDTGALAAVAAAPVGVRPDNLVERPWGGRRLPRWKNLDTADDGPSHGECFELAADPEDPEAAAHPSIGVLGDGSEILLPELFANGGEMLLGAPHLARHGPRLPLLPKTLDIAELLSVQAHPPGYPELYVVIDTEPGATLHVGFQRSLARDTLRQRLLTGRAAQDQLATMLRGPEVPDGLQATLAPLLLEPSTPAGTLDAALAPFLAAGLAERARTPIRRLHEACSEVLATLNPIPVEPGTIVYNADPASRAAGHPSAAVHALGNSAQREVVLLEVRKPGPTLRAWDHGRFPARDLAVERALDACALSATSPADYLVTPTPVPDHPGVTRSVDGPELIVEHVTPPPDTSVRRDAGRRLRTLHAIRGRLTLWDADGQPWLVLGTGHSAFLPVSVGPYHVTGEPGSELVEVTLTA